VKDEGAFAGKTCTRPNSPPDVPANALPTFADTSIPRSTSRLIPHARFGHRYRNQ
jgi:hypothetical protein